MKNRNRILMSLATIATLLLGAALPFKAQTPIAIAQSEANDFPLMERPEKNGPPKLDPKLYDLVLAENRGEAISFAEPRNIEIMDGKVRVIVECLSDVESLLSTESQSEVESPSETQSSTTQTDPFIQAVETQGEVETAARNLLQMVVPISNLVALADTSGIRMVRLPWRPAPALVSEAVYYNKFGTSEWWTAGYDGTGVKIGILDIGFAEYADRQNEGELPASIAKWPNPFDPGTDKHGTACAEIVYDIADHAQFYFAKFNTEVEYDNAVKWFMKQGVDIVSCSVGWPISGPGDGTGFICDTVAVARDARIVWAQSAGDFAESHWQGDFLDTDSDGQHEFNQNPLDEDNDINQIITAGQTVTVSLKWDDPWGASANDYDLWLLDSGGQLKDLSNRIQAGSGDPWEELTYTAEATDTYSIVILTWSTPQVVNFHLYSRLHEPFLPHTLEHPIATSSLAVPADSSNVIAVGAVYWDDPLRNLESFSSQGPTEDERTKPDLVAPDRVSTVSYGDEAFSGTSAATPHVAGAAALVRECYPGHSPEDTQAFLELRADPLGDPGKDNLYGSGWLQLLPAPNFLREPLSPNAQGVRSTFTLSVPATPPENHYQLIDDPISAPDYNSTFLGSEKTGGTFPNLTTSGGFYNIPASSIGQGTIERITVRALIAKHHWPPGKSWGYSTHQPSLVLAIYVNGTPYFQPDREMSDGWKVYTDWGLWDGFAASWSTNPNTHNPWTWADVEALQIGLDMQRPYFSGVRIYTCATQIWVDVEYTP